MPAPTAPAAGESSSLFLRSSAASRQLLLAVLEVAHCLVVVLDRNGHIVMFNRYCETSTGFSAAEVEGKLIWDVLIRPQDRGTVQAVFADLRSGEFPSAHENLWLTQSGDTRLVAWNNTILVDDDGNSEYVVATGRDITDAAARSRKAEFDAQQLRAILANAVDAVVTIDTDGLIQSVNPAAERMFGYAADEMLGQNVAMLMPAPHRERHTQYIRNYLDTGQARVIGVGREVEGRRRSGERIALELSVGEVRLGTQRLFTGIARDITRRHEDDVRKRQRIAVAGRARRLVELGAMSAGVAHEITQPLAAITSFAGAAQSMAGNLEAPPATLVRALDGIAEQAERASDIVRRLRDLFRAEGRDLARPTDLNKLVDKTLRIVAHDVEQYDVDVTLELDENLPEVVADAVQIEQIVLNLMRNSLDAMRPDLRRPRKLAVTTRTVADTAAGTRIELHVQDSGPGLPAEIEPHLFELFHTSKIGGLGVGLPLSRTIAQSHGGTLDVAHTSTNGTCMRLTLPATRAPAT